MLFPVLENQRFLALEGALKPGVIENVSELPVHRTDLESLAAVRTLRTCILKKQPQAGLTVDLFTICALHHLLGDM